MPCYSPLRGVLVSTPEGNKVSFKTSDRGQGLSLPCGRCLGCRLERARQWAVRIMHETKMHDASIFGTLTYDGEHLPSNGSLVKEHCQDFLKRLRRRIEPVRIRFFLCGEYGEQLGRPHYHIVIFGWFPPDAVLVSQTDKYKVYDSKTLNEAWGHGFTSFGSVTFDSAMYVSSYAVKKITGEMTDGHYQGRLPEFVLMSRRKGIGNSWCNSYLGDVFPADEVIVNGHQARPPRYYDSVLELRDPVALEGVKERRREAAAVLERFTLKGGGSYEVAPGRNARRLAVRERVAKAKHALKKRRLEAQ